MKFIHDRKLDDDEVGSLVPATKADVKRHHLSKLRNLRNNAAKLEREIDGDDEVSLGALAAIGAAILVAIAWFSGRR